VFIEIINSAVDIVNDRVNLINVPVEVIDALADQGGFASCRFLFYDEDVFFLFIEDKVVMLFLPHAKRGQGLVEYALILILVSLVSLILLILLAKPIGDVYSNVIEMI
jgi:pilus assembly protein Flp/PilA